jgi:hypothetical protein
MDILTYGSDTANLMEKAISVVAKQATTGNFMKVISSFPFSMHGYLLTFIFCL